MSGKPLYRSLIIFAVYSFILLAIAITYLQPMQIFFMWLAGFLFFTFIEYLFHRFFFHMKVHTHGRQKLQFAVHGNHHEAPTEATGVMIKPLIAIAVIIITSIFFYLVIRKLVLAFLPGFLFGYSCYLFIHFATHAYKPPKNLFRLLWKHHHLHHYYNDHVNFGVSSPLWDIIFNTYLNKKNQSLKTNVI